MTVSLHGKLAIVTGAAGGIGRAIAEAFAADGAHVVMADVADAAAVRVGTAEAARLDLADVAAIEAFVADVSARHPRIDILVNAAGVFDTTPLPEITPAHWRAVFDVNVIGLFALSQAVASGMREHGNGRIINIASIGGRRGDEKAAVYSASKAAVISLTQSMALALIGHGINVNAIAPGPIQTALWAQIDEDFSSRYLAAPAGSFTDLVRAGVPAGRMGLPADIVGAARFLAGPGSDFVVGQTINVDGGCIMG